MAIEGHSDFYLNFQRFGDLKRAARAQSPDAARRVAQQFEGMLVQQMLAAMRAAARVDDGLHSSYLDTYREMYDKQLAQIVAGEDRLGFARLLLRQLPTGPEPVREGGAAASAARELERRPAPASLAVVAAGRPAEPVTKPAAVDASATSPVSTESARVVLNRVVADDFAEFRRNAQATPAWREPAAFVADILPAATQAAAALGVSARLLIAQSALETGWGRHTLRLDDGRSSYNLFGIKAGPDWAGPAVRRPSLEFRDGVLAPEVSYFRAYRSPAQSLRDYVDFIQSNPRYRAALEQAGDDAGFIRAIHHAGYATDPRYADKVIDILNGDALEDSLARLGQGGSDHA